MQNYDKETFIKLRAYINSSLSSDSNDYPYTEIVVDGLADLHQSFGGVIKKKLPNITHSELSLMLKSLFNIDIDQSDVGFANYIFADRMLLAYNLIPKSIYYKLNQKRKTKSIRKMFLRNFSTFRKLEHIQKRIEITNPKYSELIKELQLIMDHEITSLNEEQQRILSSSEKDIHSYRSICSFHITPENIKGIKGYDLLVKLGWFHPKNNPGGVVKDHRLSIHYGYNNQIDPSIIGHIKNCEFLTVSENSSKSSDSSILLEELELEIME